MLSTDVVDTRRLLIIKAAGSPLPAQSPAGRFPGGAAGAVGL